MGDWPILGCGGLPVLASATPSWSSANTKGSWVEISSSCPFDTGEISIHVSLGDHNSTGLGTLTDIGVGAASSETAIISNIFAGNFQAQNDQKPNVSYSFPLCIPQGSRVSCRTQGSTTAGTLAGMRVTFFPQRFTTQKPARSIETYGADTGTSTGTTITAGAGFTQMVASTARPIRELGIIWAPTTSADQSWETYVAVGAAAAEVNIQEWVGAKRVGDIATRFYRLPFVLPPGNRLTGKCVTGNGYLVLYGAV